MATYYKNYFTVIFHLDIYEISQYILIFRARLQELQTYKPGIIL